MSITEAGKSAIQQSASEVADRAQDMASDAWRYAQRTGDKVSGFVHRRPVETALISAAVACLITGLAFWATRPD